MKPAALAGLAAALLAALVVGFQPFAHDNPGSSASRTVFSFAYALDHNNYGRACSYMADGIRGTGRQCSTGLAFNEGFNLVLFGADIFAGMHVVPGSETVVSDTRVVYQVASAQIPPTDVVVEKGANGKWRITQIGAS